MSIGPDAYAQASEENVFKFSTPGRPPRDVIDAINAGVSTITRRVEIYQRDNTTLWLPMSDKRLVTGTVTVDSTSDERRKLDVTLDNTDGLLDADPANGFWYDKIIKVYRGVKYSTADISLTAAIIENDGYTYLPNILQGAGIASRSVSPDYASASQYQFAVSYRSPGQKTAYSALLRALYNSGVNIITIGTGNGVSEIPFITSATNQASTTWGVTPPSGDSPVAGKYTASAASASVAGASPGAVVGAQVLAQWTMGDSTVGITASVGHATGAFWLDIHLPDLADLQAQKMLRAAVQYIQRFYDFKQWEFKLGEFMIDGMNEDNFPHQQKVTGRDFTKKLLLSKVANNTTFEAGKFSLLQVVRSVAINAGIAPDRLKLDIDPTIILTSDMSYDRGTARWNIIKDACTSFNYELFFDSQGYLVARQYIDPTLGKVSWRWNTGRDGNLVTFNKSITDSLIFNHQIVWGDPADDSVALPYFGEAINDDPNSPTCVQRIGDRVDTLATNWMNSDADCVKLAKQRLAISSLESYNLNYSSIYYPWLEAGEIGQIDLPNAKEWEPNKFLVDTISFPLDLGPMSATGKRITFVGDDGGESTVNDEYSISTGLEIGDIGYSGATSGTPETPPNMITANVQATF